MRRIWLSAAVACLAGLSLGGCASAPAPAAPGSEQDSFVLLIDTGRMSVFNDRINSALDLMESAPEVDPATPEAAHDAELRSAAANIRNAWIEFLAVRTRACLEGKFAQVSCSALAPPAWLAEPADTPVASREIVRRLSALQVAMEPLLGLACDAGRRLSKEEGADMFCSVE